MKLELMEIEDGFADDSVDGFDDWSESYEGREDWRSYGSPDIDLSSDDDWYETDDDDGMFRPVDRQIARRHH